MAIRYPGGTTVHVQLDASDSTRLLDSIRDALVTAGWSNTETKAYIVMTFNGLPSNNQTCTFDGRTYRFVNTLSAANDVKIGATAAQCASNLYDAINDNQANEGITYGNGTTQHPNLQAILTSSNVVRIEWKSAGYGNGFSASSGLSNVTLDSGTGRYGGNKLDTAKTPAGLQMRMWFYWTSGAAVRAKPMTVDESLVATRETILDTQAGRLLECIANKYQFFIFLLGSSTTARTGCGGGVPYVRSGQVAPMVSSVSNNGGQYEVTTSVAHGLTTGQFVFISGAQGVTNLNGSWRVTVTSPTTYVLEGSSYQSGYVPDSARSAGPGQISRCFWYSTHYNGIGAFRQGLYISGLSSNGLAVLNQHNCGSGNVDTPLFRLGVPVGSGLTTVSRNAGNMADLTEARIGVPIPDGGPFTWLGELWGAFIVTAPADIDVVLTNFDGHNWIQITDNDVNGSLWLATN